MTTTVTALLVSHDGDRWLPAVLEGLTGQTRKPDHLVAVDTGSTDTSRQLLRQSLGDDAVLTVSPRTGYGEAVAAGLHTLPPRPEDRPGEDWIWLLHDDSAPAPDALERMLAVAETSPSISVLGPKLREWPSLRRLLEVGVTISGTGRRETGLERGEYDQGQHDELRDVLAVNTAGMLVRRALLESLGFEPRLPVFGNDIDFGWRSARRGHRTVVVPDAVLFHVEAAHRGLRRTPVTGAFRRGERAAALYTLLVNGSALALPIRAVRLLLGSLVRALGMLLVRAPGEAVDELAAVAGTYLRPVRILSGRRTRRRSATVSQREVRPLLAPAWLPYRHGLDLVGDLAAGLAHQAGDLSAARRARPAEASETGPVAEEMQNLPADSGLMARLLVSPVAAVFAVLVVAALVSARGLVGAGTLSGGALLPAPGSALDWWRSYLTSWHQIGTGTSAPAAPYLLPLAVVGTVLVGKASLVVDLVFLLAVPLAAWGAYRFLRRVTSSAPMSLWGAVAYGVLPVATGSVQGGRLGTVVGTLVLPWLAHAALFLHTSETDDRRARAAWRTSLWLALLAAFVPLAWGLAAVTAAVAVVMSRSRRLALSRSVLIPLLATLVLLLPWSVATWGHQGAASWLFEAGLPVPKLTGAVSRWDVVLGRPGGGAPGWMSAGVLVAALVALARPDTRRTVLRAWVLIVLALGATALLASGTFSLADSPTDQRLWLGFPLVLAQAAGITAAALAGTGVRRRLSGASFGWQQPLGVLVVGLAALTPVVSLGWWVWSGSGGPLDRASASEVPTYMSDAAADDPANGVLVIRGARPLGFRYVLLRQAGLRLGDDAVVPSVHDQSGLTRYVQDVATDPAPSDITALSRSGVAYIYAPAPADVTLVGNLDSASGVTQGSADHPGARAWQLERTPSMTALHRDGDDLRRWLLLVEGVAVVVVVVLAAPTRKVRA